ncbi:Glycosyl transferases group 1 [uncultured Roseburia sp.]|uniref:Glycosyltransferase n=1 Tax=Brotonthovivens ammoniilytica TaxID=2981725 RepID=A0ABT2TGI9_9FIRM|nr:glycosyltransferase [Brotonthovivens ammoniilytica]MCU6760817.1 glycosyltransferase [Brotonthovivens ammoniilytica]SCI10242.1 Glycosyl transferases group 1 [uncultured Roseburia sp.]
MENIKRIVITSDLLRPVWINGKAKNKETVRINKYFDFLSGQLKEAVNVPVEKISTENSKFNFFVFYRLCNVTFKNTNSWLEIYDLDSIPRDAINYFGKYFDNSFIICHEMPPIFKKICDKLNLYYIDIRIHPVRFLDDHMFSMATNHPQVFQHLKKYLVNEKVFYIYANLYKTTVDFYDLNIDKNSALIVGQTNVDSALYENGKVHTIFEYKNQIEKLGKEYKTVYYKPHPFNGDLKKVYDFLKQFPFIKIINQNIYYLLANENIKAVYAISSGVLTEAKYFEKKAYPFFKTYLDYTYDKNSNYSPNLYLTIMNDFYEPNFWNDLFTGTIPTKDICESFNMPIRPNRMRAALNDYWGNTVLDPDVITVKKEKQFILDQEDYSTQIKYLQEQVSMLSSQINMMKNNVIFEKNILKRIAKKLLFYYSEHNTSINSYAVMKKMRRMSLLCGDKFTSVKNIKCITYRPKAPKGGRGGGGAVLSAMESIIQYKYKNLPIKYVYSEKDGIWHTLRNRYFNEFTYPNYINENSNLIMLWAAIAFVIEETKDDRDTLYICHEYSTAFALGLMGKKYILVIHTQGPRIEEKTNLGERMTNKEEKIISSCERYALKHAQKVCFPSIGGQEYFFNSKYCVTDKSDINLGDILYNTVYAQVSEDKIPEILEESEKCSFLSVGTLTYAKGQDNVCTFLETLLKKDTINKYRWICVGRGPYAEEINQRANKLADICDNFEYIYIEKCSFRQVKYLQNICDYYIMLHRISIFDLATLEAMQNSNGIILSKTGGNLEYNCENNVIYLEDNNYTKLAETIMNEDKEYWKALNLKCYNNYFSKVQFKNRYYKQIDSVIKDLKI